MPIEKSKIVCEDFKKAAANACDEFRGLKERVLETSELNQDEFESECSHEFESLWEAEQAEPFSVVKGKEIIRKIKSEYGPRASPLQFKVKIMKCLRKSESKSWQEMRSEIIAGVTDPLSSQ